MRGFCARGYPGRWSVARSIANFPFPTPSHKLALCPNEGSARKQTKEVNAWLKKTVRSKSKALLLKPVSLTYFSKKLSIKYWNCSMSLSVYSLHFHSICIAALYSAIIFLQLSRCSNASISPSNISSIMTYKCSTKSLVLLLLKLTFATWNNNKKYQHYAFKHFFATVS